MKKKLIIGLLIFAMLPFLAKAAPNFAFYIFIAVFAVILITIFRRGKGGGSVTPTKQAPGPHGDDSKRRRIINAVRAVRKNKMSLAKASEYYGVSEREIKTVHYLDYLLTY